MKQTMNGRTTKNKTKDMIFTALFAILIALCAWISVPTVVPFTMQTFAVFLALNFLGGKKGTICVCIYLLLGIIGLPVFSNGTAGIGILLGNTGGYMMGWLFSGMIMWLLEKLMGSALPAQIISMAAGWLVCYAAGTAWFMVAYTKNVQEVSLQTALGWCVMPFIIPDFIKLSLALFLSRKLKKISTEL